MVVVTRRRAECLSLCRESGILAFTIDQAAHVGTWCTPRGPVSRTTRNDLGQQVLRAGDFLDWPSSRR